MIWSCEINYLGWEDDIHHHHFFIKDDTRPSEQAVVDYYNAHYYNPDDWKFDERIEPLEEDEYSNWQAIEPNGYNYENVRIIIKQLKVEEWETQANDELLKNAIVITKRAHRIWDKVEKYRCRLVYGYDLGIDALNADDIEEINIALQEYSGALIEAMFNLTGKYIPHISDYESGTKEFESEMTLKKGGKE